MRPWSEQNEDPRSVPRCYNCGAILTPGIVHFPRRKGVCQMDDFPAAQPWQRPDEWWDATS